MYHIRMCWPYKGDVRASWKIANASQLAYHPGKHMVYIYIYTVLAIPQKSRELISNIF